MDGPSQQQPAGETAAPEIPLPVEPLELAPLPVEPIDDSQPVAALPDAESILDYASPRPRGKMRLPANSRIVCHPEGDGIRIVETLAGRVGAIGAMCFAIFILVEWAAIFLDMQSRMNWSGRLAAAPAMGIPWLGYLALLLAVVHQTWRKTVLRANATRVQLRFDSPMRHTHYEWAAADVQQVLAVMTDPRNRWPLGELQLLLPGGARAHLFTDHRYTEIQGLARAMRNAMGTP